METDRSVAGLLGEGDYASFVPPRKEFHPSRGKGSLAPVMGQV
jgi:hypothetical protein